MYGLMRFQTTLQPSAMIRKTRLKTLKNTGLLIFMWLVKKSYVSIRLFGLQCLWHLICLFLSRYLAMVGLLLMAAKCQNQKAMLLILKCLLTDTVLTRYVISYFVKSLSDKMATSQTRLLFRELIQTLPMILVTLYQEQSA
ncbi:hypothetical protein SDC9_157594 [bioreactor metagenome]|uniref:Uncharacterized protein n=1 Tax=bioreactor metagenome TaxID=1076179 RepID=A0A645FAD8_9ZZZZ